MSFRRLIVVFTVVLAVSMHGSLSTASAQEPERIDSNIQGAVGLGLIGAELGLVLPALIGFEGVWPYIVFPVALGAGGGVAGYFLIDDGNNVDAGVAVLATGVALIIPAVVTTLALTAYDPEEEVEEAGGGKKVDENKDFGDDADSFGDEVQEPAAPAAPAEEATEPEAAPPETEPAPESSLIRRAPNGAIRIGIPAVSFGTAYSRSEVETYGLRQVTELRVPLIGGTF